MSSAKNTTSIKSIRSFFPTEQEIMERSQYERFLHNFINKAFNKYDEDDLISIFQTSYEVDFITLPIVKIDGLKVVVKIVLCSGSIYIVVKHKFKTLYNYYITDVGGVDSLTDFIQSPDTTPKGRYWSGYIYQITQLKYCNLIGKFINIHGTNLIRASRNIINEHGLKQMGWEIEDCCVCLEKTTTKLKGCNHTICIQCIDRLENATCPLCRKGFNSTTLDIVNQADGFEF
jgi:hypothetical protein